MMDFACGIKVHNITKMCEIADAVVSYREALVPTGKGGWD